MKSAFANHLHTNYVPSKEETERIRADLALRKQEFERLDKVIRDLSAQRTEIRDYIDAHESLVSVPRRFPRKIVENIFLACLPTDRNSSMARREAPLVLTFICQDWRKIALTMPALWASVHIQLPLMGPPSGDEKRVHLLAQWLARSASHPLSLSLVANIWEFEEITWDSEGGAWGGSWVGLREPSDLSKTLAILMGHASHWCNLDLREFSTYPSFNYGGSSSQNTLMKFAETHAPMLESLRVSGHQTVAGSLALLAGSHLREVTLPSLSADTLVSEIPLAWAQLTRLAFVNPGPDDLNRPKIEYSDLDTDGLSLTNALLLLQKCPQLECFEFTPRATTASSQDPSFMAITLSSLRSFKMSNPTSNLDPNSLKIFWETLNMPHLRRIHIPKGGFDGSDTDFIVQLARKTPSLEHLSISLWRFPRDAFLQAVSILPLLTSLEFCECTVGYTPWGYYPGAEGDASAPEIMKLLISKDSTPPNPIWLRVEALIVRRTRRLTPSDLQAFLQWHVDHNTRLRRLAVEFQPGMFDENVLAGGCKYITRSIDPPRYDVEAFRAHGLDISFTIAPARPQLPYGLGEV